MRYLIILFIVLIVACQSKTEEAKLKDTMEGDWLVLLADHQLENEDQRQVYGHIQDSVIDAKCHKLIRFSEDGSFQQIDYPDKKGKWAVSPDLNIFMGSGGTGFDDFKGKYLSYKENEL